MIKAKADKTLKAMVIGKKTPAGLGERIRRRRMARVAGRINPPEAEQKLTKSLLLHGRHNPQSHRAGVLQRRVSLSYRHDRQALRPVERQSRL